MKRFVDFTLYPTPAANEINLSISNQTGIASVTLIDIYGNKLQQMSQAVQFSSIININTSNLYAGTYFINVIINGINTLQKFLKE